MGRIEGILKERYRDFKPKFAVEKLAMKERGKVNDVRYQFSARDVYSRWDRSRAY